MSAINLDSLREYHQGAVADVFDNRNKYIVCVDNDLELLLKTTMVTNDLLGALPDNVVELHKTEDPFFPFDGKVATRVVFIIQSRLHVLKKVAGHVRNLAEKHKISKRGIQIYLVPRQTLIAEHVLTVEGVRGYVENMRELDLDIAVVDEGVLSMGLEKVSRELLVDGESSVLYSVAKSIVKMMLVFGEIENMKWKGTYSDLVGKLIQQMSTETADLLTGQSSAFHTLFLIDRMSDLSTPMLVEGTYGGIIREVFDVSNDVLIPPVEFLDPHQKPVESVKLDSVDPIYKSIRDSGLSGVKQKLKRRATAVQSKYDKKESLNTPAELRAFLDNLPILENEKRCLSIHLDINVELKKALDMPQLRNLLYYQKQIVKGEATKDVSDAIEEMMYKEEKAHEILRLICLYSHCTGGIKSKQYESWKTLFVQIYGLSVLEEWEQLEKTRLLLKSETGKVNLFASLRKSLDLFDPHYSSSSVNASYHGYAPIIPKILSKVVSSSDWNKAWASLKPCLNQMPGPASPDEEKPPDMLEKGKTRNVLVFVIGGITNSEISALRILEDDLATDEDVPPVRFTIATTSIITGKSFIDAMTGKEE